MPIPRRRLVVMVLVLVLVVVYSTASVHAIPTPCNFANFTITQECPGLEQCQSGRCQCPLNGMNRDGYFSSQDQADSDDTDPTSPWATKHHCEYWPYEIYSGAVIAFRVQGLLLHGSVLIMAVVAAIRLRRIGRFSRNLQTCAVVLVALDGTLYVIHYGMDPFAPWRGRLDTAVLSYLPAPVVVSLYNVVLLFLRDLTATQLNTRREANRRILMLIFTLLAVFAILLVNTSQITRYDLYYYVFWATYLGISLAVSTYMARQLHLRLAYRPPPPVSMPNNHIVVAPVIRSPGAVIMMAGHDGGLSTLDHRIYESRAVVRPMMVGMSSAENVDTVDQARIAALPNRFKAPPLPPKAIELRRRILRFMIGSIICSVGWFLVLVIGIITRDASFTQQFIIFVVFRVLESGWCFLNLVTFWPYDSSVKRAVVAPTPRPGIIVQQPQHQQQQPPQQRYHLGPNHGPPSPEQIMVVHGQGQAHNYHDISPPTKGPTGTGTTGGVTRNVVSPPVAAPTAVASPDNGDEHIRSHIKQYSRSNSGRDHARVHPETDVVTAAVGGTAAIGTHAQHYPYMYHNHNHNHNHHHHGGVASAPGDGHDIAQMGTSNVSFEPLAAPRRDMHQSVDDGASIRTVDMNNTHHSLQQPPHGHGRLPVVHTSSSERTPDTINSGPGGGGGMGDMPPLPTGSVQDHHTHGGAATTMRDHIQRKVTFEGNSSGSTGSGSNGISGASHSGNGGGGHNGNNGNNSDDPTGQEGMNPIRLDDFPTITTMSSPIIPPMISSHNQVPLMAVTGGIGVTPLVASLPVLGHPPTIVTRQQSRTAITAAIAAAAAPSSTSSASTVTVGVTATSPSPSSVPPSTVA